MFVCKPWLQACKDPCLNKVFDLETRYIDWVAKSPRQWTPEFERRIDSMLRSVVVWSAGFLSQIRVRHCSDRSLSLVAERCPNLEILSIKSSPHVTDETMAKIANKCPKLRELDVSFCYKISHKSLAFVGKSCPNLQILRRNLKDGLDPSQHMGIVPRGYLNACPEDGDSEADAIAKCMPNLLQLEIRFSKLTVNGLMLISDGCQNLESLDLSGCANVMNRDISNALSKLKNLKDVKKPMSMYYTERHGHWRLYDERFQRDVFRI